MLAAAAGCEFDVDRGPDWLSITIRGIESDSADASAFVDQLMELAETHFIYRIVLDLHRVKKLDRDFIEQLVQLNQQIHKHDGFLRICGLSATNRRELEKYGLDDLCLAYDTREEAVFGVCRPRMPR